jgi:hypothetical protein
MLAISQCTRCSEHVVIDRDRCAHFMTRWKHRTSRIMHQNAQIFNDICRGLLPGALGLVLLSGDQTGLIEQARDA